jgi:hypothetical protein
VTVLRYLPQPDGGYSLVLLHVTAPPPTWVPRSRIKQWLPRETEVFVPAGSRLRLFAGQPNSQDESHFTIGYELGGVPGTIDGWLRDNGYIELKTRDGPAIVKTAPL